MKGRFSGPSHDLKRSRNLHSMPQFHAFHASFIASPYVAEVSDVDIGMKFEVVSKLLGGGRDDLDWFDDGLDGEAVVGLEMVNLRPRMGLGKNTIRPCSATQNRSHKH